MSFSYASRLGINIGRRIGRVSEVIIHTEAGAVMAVGSTLAQEHQRMRAIHRFHQSLGWAGFGYSAGTNPRSESGRIHEGRGFGRSGAHTVGKNSTSLAVVCFGHGDRHPMSEGAIRGIRAWIGEGIRRGMLTSRPRITGHRDYSPKSCPGNRIYPQLGRLRGVTGPESSADDSLPLSVGSRGENVRKLQTLIQKIMNAEGSGRTISIDGIFGDETRREVVRYGKLAGLSFSDESDPQVGERTFAALEDLLERMEGFIVREEDKEYMESLADRIVHGVLRDRRGDRGRNVRSQIQSPERYDEAMARGNAHEYDLPVVLQRIEERQTSPRDVDIAPTDEVPTIVVAVNDIDEGIARTIEAATGWDVVRHDKDDAIEADRAILVGAAQRLTKDDVGVDEVVRVSGSTREETAREAYAFVKDLLA